jgi:hypothetical protein
VHGDGSSLKVSTPTQPTINMEQLQNARHRAEVELSKARNAMDCSSLGGRARTATARQRLQILNEEITRRVKAAEPPMPPPLEWDDLDKLRAQIAS